MLLLSSTALAQTLDQCVTDDYNALPTTDCGNNVCQAEVVTYYTYLQSVPTIADSIDYCDGAGTSPALPQDVRDRLWEKFEYAQANPTLGTEPVPAWASYLLNTDVHFVAGRYYGVQFEDCNPDQYGCLGTVGTRDELLETWTAKVAHAVWLDVVDQFPYKMSDYTEQEIRYLLDPEYLWNTNPTDYNHLVGTAGYASWTTGLPLSNVHSEHYLGAFVLALRVVDHSPWEVWEELKGYDVHTANSPRTAINRVLEIGARTVHGNRCDAPAFRTVKDNMDSRNVRWWQRSQLDPSDPCYMPVGTSTQYTMPSGCNDRSSFVIHLLRNANIPAYYRNGVLPEVGHSMFVIPTGGVSGYTTLHGDHTVYGFPVYQNSEYLSKYQDYVSGIVTPLGCTELNGPYKLGNHDSARKVYRSFCGALSFMHPTQPTSGEFCTLGFEESILGSQCRKQFTGCEDIFFDQWKARWADKYGCSGDPP